MVDEQKYERELGGINAKLEYIKTSMDKADMNFAKVFTRLDSLDSNGCALGKRNSEEIEKLRSQPSRIISIGAAVIAALAAVFSWKHGGP